MWMVYVFHWPISRIVIFGDLDAWENVPQSQSDLQNHHHKYDFETVPTTLVGVIPRHIWPRLDSSILLLQG